MNDRSALKATENMKAGLVITYVFDQLDKISASMYVIQGMIRFYPMGSPQENQWKYRQTSTKLSGSSVLRHSERNETLPTNIDLYGISGVEDLS